MHFSTTLLLIVLIPATYSVLPDYALPPELFPPNPWCSENTMDNIIENACSRYLGYNRTDGSSGFRNVHCFNRQPYKFVTETLENVVLNKCCNRACSLEQVRKLVCCEKPTCEAVCFTEHRRELGIPIPDALKPHVKTRISFKDFKERKTSDN
ncbi:hypothetical protein L596_000408 [Steinernema carpocapsae]|uniref:Insulin-like domain-containing protein n=1 Tax=Steinernema carpocapsae TaxID=34508 RepID=A0A4U8UJG1_STECR|nr:hypothetical protein L596_000408 [Steinernema carpocapsae]